jgi:geranylgeranyl diphosphate synthase type II
LAEYPERGGKGVRSTFLVATCAALGGSEQRAIPFAVAVELLHNAFLVHDDIQDGSSLRRGQPALPVQYGIGLALCTGNALAVEAFAAMRDATRGTHVSESVVLDEMELTIRRTLEGQAQELGWEHEQRLDVTVVDYLEMVVRKSAWYSVMLPCRLGLLVASRQPLGERFRRFGALAGSVLQIVDDLESLLAPAVVTGKELGHDILEGKRSLPVIHCLSTGSTSARRRLAELLLAARQCRDSSAVPEIIDVLRRAGSIDYAQRSAGALAKAARSELDTELAAAVSLPHAEMLATVVDALIARCP